jgi:catechol 2,3-dioxygenase-like lactoylglutathione lyase family enzyme
VVPDYDEAINFFTRALNFELCEDTPLGGDKRWVVVRPPGRVGSGLLLARASNPAQAARIGDQTGGRVFLFLETENFDRDHARMTAAGVRFVEKPRHEAYGVVAVFEDLCGNRWDLIEAKSTYDSETRLYPMTPRQVVEEWVRRFNASDANGLAELYDADAVNHQVVQEPVAGKIAIREMFRREFAAADMTCNPEVIHEAGDVAILEWTDPLGLRGCGFFTVKGGRIVFQRGYRDKLSFLRNHGLPLD